MQTTRTLFFSMIFLLFAQACATPTEVAFKSSDKLQIRAFDLKEPSKVGALQPDGPIKIDLKNKSVQAFQVSSPGKENQIWVFVKGEGEKLQANVNLNNSQQQTVAQNDPQRLAKVNSLNRFVLGGLKSLYEKDLKTAKELAEQASKVEIEAAAPHILKGLVALQEGQRDQARTAFLQAKLLDPADKNIDELLKEVSPE